jgi:hypothetical protein
VYTKHFTAFGEMIESQEANLYTFEADDPIELPFAMNLNYTDNSNAQVLSGDKLQKAIQIMSQYDAGAIINAGDYLDVDESEWKESPFASQMNHSRDHLIHILSSIAKSLGQVVINPERGDAHMENQVLVTTPVRMIKVSTEEAMQLLGTTVDNPTMGNTNQDEEEDDGEYGMGGDWWKNPGEDIINIAKTIDEDLI